MIFHKSLPKVSGATIKTAALCGIPLLLSILFQTIGLKYTSVSNSAFITGMVVLLIPIFKMVFYKKQVRPMVWVSCLIALAGLYVITLKNGLEFNAGDLWTAACTVTLALYVLQAGKFAHAPYPMARVTIIMTVCTIGSMLGGLATLGVDWLPREYEFWKGVLFSSLFGTVYMYSIQNYSQRFLEEEKIALAYLTEPIFATMAAVFLINEEVTVHTYIGGAMILAALFLSEINTSRLQNSILKVSSKRSFK